MDEDPGRDWFGIIGFYVVVLVGGLCALAALDLGLRMLTRAHDRTVGHALLFVAYAVPMYAGARLLERAGYRP